MSQRPPASGPPSENPQETSYGPPTPLHVATTSPLSYRVPNVGGVVAEQPASQPTTRGTPAQHFALPSLSYGPNVTSEQPTTRPLGVHSILNPSHSDASEDLSRTQSSLKFESPSSTVSSIQRYPMGSAPPSPSVVSLGPYPPSPGDGSGRSLLRGPRRILTPKSPGRSRVPSLHAIQPATATINASEAPFAPARGRIYSPDPSGRGSENIPPMPTPPTGRMPLNYPPSIPSNPVFPDRRASGGAPQPIPSQSASPSPSHSSYNQYNQGNTYPQSSQPSAPYSGSHPAGGGYSSSSNLAMVYGTQADSTTLGQGSLQMTFNTDSGPLHVPVTLDMQHASRVADEKRKRNAGASARFRQRRKEKEKEASETIAKLEQDIRDLAEDRDFYRSERNYFRDMLSRTQTNILPRPQSPVHRRPPPTELSGSQGSPWQPSEERVGDGRNTRRRTSAYTSGYESSPPPPATLPPPVPSAYRPPLLQPPFPDPRATPGSGLPPGALVPPPPPRSQTHDPYRREPYDRSWNPAP